jgi:hypothetical protein
MFILIPGYDQGQGQGAQYGQPAQQPYIPGQQMFNDPMAGMAMQYGTDLAGKGQEIVQEKVRILSNSNAELPVLGSPSHLQCTLVPVSPNRRTWKTKCWQLHCSSLVSIF